MARRRTPTPPEPTANGAANGKPRIDINDPFTVNELTARMDAILSQITGNATITSRSALLNQGLDDPRRSIEDECGYPALGSGISIELFKQLYDREAIAARVVQVMPRETWQVTPKVYEDEDPETDTEFEAAWDELAASVRGPSHFQDEEGSPIWEYLVRADILSGLGAFGVLLIGVDDGKTLEQPIEGLMVQNRRAKRVVRPVVNRRTGQVREVHAGWRLVKHDKPQPVMPDSPLHPGEYAALTANEFGQVGAEVPVVNRDERGQVEWGKVKATHQAPPLSEKEKRIINAWRDEAVRNAATVSKDIRQHTNPDLTQGADSQAAGGGMPIAQDQIKGAFGAYPTGTSLKGTDQQYFGVIAGPSEELIDKPAGEGRKVLFLRPFSEDLIQVVRYEWNVRNPRFGLPVMYRITLNDPREVHSGIGLPLATVFVHWSRVIHFADNLNSSEIFGVPRMRPVLNNLLALRKVYAADAEGYWRNAILKLFLETHPQLGGEVDIDYADLQDQLEQMMNGLQQWMATRGMSAKAIPPGISDPTPHVAVQIEAICIQLGIPVRVFKGSERGELASSQDDSSWNDRLRHRQMAYVTPRVIVPFVDRLIMIGVLPEPEGYSVEWPDLDSLTDKDKAAICLSNTQALAAYIAGGCDNMIEPKSWLTSENFMNMDEEEAEAVLSATQSHLEDIHPEEDPESLVPGHGPAETPQADLEEQMDLQKQAIDKGIAPDPNKPQPVPPQKLGAGQALVHGETGATLAKGPPAPKPAVKGLPKA